MNGRASIILRLARDFCKVRWRISRATRTRIDASISLRGGSMDEEWSKGEGGREGGGGARLICRQWSGPGIDDESPLPLMCRASLRGSEPTIRISRVLILILVRHAVLCSVCWDPSVPSVLMPVKPLLLEKPMGMLITRIGTKCFRMLAPSGIQFLSIFRSISVARSCRNACAHVFSSRFLY